MQSLQLSLTDPVDPLDERIECLKLINQLLDLRDFSKLITRIEHLNNSFLTKVKNNFTTQFLAKLKSYMKNKRMKNQDVVYIRVLALSNFSAFVTLYDQLANQSLDKVAESIEQFFDFVASYELILVAEELDVKNELEIVGNEKYWNSKLNFCRGGLELIRTGVQLTDLVSFIKNSFKIDPSSTVRAITDSKEEL